MTKHEAHPALQEMCYAAVFYVLAAGLCTLFVYLG